MSNKYCYTTLITKDKYTDGVIVLARSLEFANSKYPLVVLHTDKVSQDALDKMSNQQNVILKHTEHLALTLKEGDVVKQMFERFS
ncbi:hypothetical protein HDU76_001719, partial [Blyttiomyces sp. JEL0837]